MSKPVSAKRSLGKAFSSVRFKHLVADRVRSFPKELHACATRLAARMRQPYSLEHMAYIVELVLRGDQPQLYRLGLAMNVAQFQLIRNQVADVLLIRGWTSRHPPVEAILNKRRRTQADAQRKEEGRALPQVKFIQGGKASPR